jgi:hypothetical protein
MNITLIVCLLIENVVDWKKKILSFRRLFKIFSKQSLII